jgi:orotidine-5'-phosphate decarboxylase
MLKTHVDIIEDFSMDKMQQLVELALKHNFLIFEDRKFADIGNTVKLQFGRGVYKISQWANVINAHAITGPGCIAALREVFHREL